MSWANLRAAFPALSPAQLHRLLTQYQLASAMGPMSAWEPGAQDRPDAFKSGEPPRRAGLWSSGGQAGGFPGGAHRASDTPSWAVVLRGCPAHPWGPPGGGQGAHSPWPSAQLPAQVKGPPALMEPEDGSSPGTRSPGGRAGSPGGVTECSLSTRAVYVHVRTHAVHTCTRHTCHTHEQCRTHEHTPYIGTHSIICTHVPHIWTQCCACVHTPYTCTHLMHMYTHHACTHTTLCTHTRHVTCTHVYACTFYRVNAPLISIMHVTQKQQRVAEGTDTVGLWPAPATPLPPRSLAWPQGPPPSRPPGSPGRRPPLPLTSSRPRPR